MENFKSILYNNIKIEEKKIEIPGLYIGSIVVDNNGIEYEVLSIEHIGDFNKYKKYDFDNSVKKILKKSFDNNIQNTSIFLLLRNIKRTKEIIIKPYDAISGVTLKNI